MTRLHITRQRHERRTYFAAVRRLLNPTHVSQPVTVSQLFHPHSVRSTTIFSSRLHSSLSPFSQPPSAKAFRQKAHKRCVAATAVSLQSTASVASSASLDILGSRFRQSSSNIFVTPQQSRARAGSHRATTRLSQRGFASVTPPVTPITPRSHHTARIFSYQEPSSFVSSRSQNRIKGTLRIGRATLSTMPHTTDETAAPAVKLVTESLDKPSLDNRSYRIIELGNGLEALLVHDSETDKASASLDVGVGNFSDPTEMPGTAHAVEHVSIADPKRMFFMVFSCINLPF